MSKDKRITVRVDDDLYQALDTEADNRGIPLSTHIRNILEDRDVDDQLEARVSELEDELNQVQDRLRQLEENENE